MNAKKITAAIIVMLVGICTAIGIISIFGFVFGGCLNAHPTNPEQISQLPRKRVVTPPDTSSSIKEDKTPPPIQEAKETNEVKETKEPDLDTQQKVEQPKEGVVYVWSHPMQGHQTLVTLAVIDGETIDAAYLVPIRIKLKGIKAPGIDTKGGKDAQAALEKLLVGQLRTAQLWGPDQSGGGITADIWIPPLSADKQGQWLSQALKQDKK